MGGCRCLKTPPWETAAQSHADPLKHADTLRGACTLLSAGPYFIMMSFLILRFLWKGAFYCISYRQINQNASLVIDAKFKIFSSGLWTF